MKKAVAIGFFSFVFINITSLFATDFIDIQKNISYGKESSNDLEMKGVSVAVASEDSLKYCEYDSKMRIVKETVWADDFSKIDQVVEWVYQDTNSLPYKKIDTNKNGNIVIETEYEYDSKGRTIKETESQVTNKNKSEKSADNKNSNIKCTEYSYHKKKNESGSMVLRVDSIEYVNGAISKKVTWLSANERQVTLYYNNNIENTSIYSEGIKKSEFVIQDGKQIGQYSWN
ncbi:MAG: hypothetical protein BKP49_08425 [Treponema sp. CETP13]|nr:MAG: hypothetical protein BKP49_08425 [Treponema sp. CETP13]